MSRRLLIATLTIIGLSIALPAAAGTLTQTPLTLVNRVPSNVLFSLSVEFPTANTAAYQDSNGYTASKTYRGLFDSEKCYDYSSADGRFNPVSSANSHACTGHWSGNFLNWATMTGLDEFRHAMTGGNRVVDTASLTVLQRSYQSGQGGTSNFPNKTYSGTGATPYPSTANLTISNQGQGTRMTVALGGSGVADCANPTLSGSTFSCSITMQNTNETGSCTTWTGSGTSTSPYRCSTFAAFSGSGTPTSISPGTTATASSGTTTDTVTCSNPSYGSSFSCTLTNAASASGSCTTWAGTGTSASPFSCSNFGNFGGTTFTSSSQAAATSFSTGGSTTESVNSCSYGSSQITCTGSTSGRQISCSTTGSGTKSSPYTCSSSSTWTISGTPAATETSYQASSGYTGGSGNRYYPITQITYSTPSQTYYYIPSYTGSDSASTYYYYSTYNLTFGGSTVYNVNVKVCDASVGLESNCVLYGNGTSYKPVGELQRNGDQMRFGVFSYYNANDVDNAVMRSKAKYVAPTKWTASGPTSNSNMEWSATDGTLVTNPDPTEATNSQGGAVSNSGVINYINKFGLTSQSYKTYDNVGKLYYETLKYLRGLQPTTAFYNKATTGNGDGFPIITTWDDPIQYSCQKNFIITMGDTHTWCDKRLPGGLFTSGGSCGPYNSQTADFSSLGGDTGVDVGLWTNKLGTLEGNSNLATTWTENSASFYMSGLAYWAAYNGFRTKDGKSMKAKTYVIDVQEYADLGQNTQYWYATKYGGADKFNSDGSPYDSTINETPAITPPTKDSWWTNSTQTTGKWPKTLLPAGDPDRMIDAVKTAFGDIAAKSGTASAAALSSGTLNTNTGLYVYQSSYNSSDWSGDVSAYHINSTNLTQDLTPTWKATDFLTRDILNPASGTPPWQTRRIITFNDGLNADSTESTATNGRRGVEFQASTTSTNGFTTNFSPRQQALLSLNPGSIPADTGSDRVDYLRGDKSNEKPDGQQWRLRNSPLGDFVNSSAVYVRRPSAAEIPYADQSTFNSYVTAVASRTPVVYAGSNDGMLHVFNASDASDDGTSAAAKTANSGKEMLAYVPAAVYPNLKNLTSDPYTHNYFVDNTPVIADAQLSSAACTPSSDTTKCWRTVVTGGLGGGGQGIYALNGTDPSTFGSASAASLVFWEFTDQDDADLGNTFGQPLVRKMNNGKWAVIFGNGYNNTAADGKASSDGRAYLYILMLDGPGPFSSARGNQWTLGTDYYKIQLTAPNEGSTTPLSPANGLSTVYGVDKNGDNLVDYLYAGDRYGNLWKIDVSSSNPASWGSAFGSSSTPLPLFTAVTADSTPKRQQITTSPFVQPNPNGGFMVMFGTGSFVDISDNTGPFDTDSFYGIWDKDDGTQVTGRSQLQRQASLAYDSSSGYGIVSNCSVQYSATAAAPSAATTFCPSSLAPSLDSDGNVAQQLGWVLDLNFQVSSSNTGERYISSPLPILNSGLLSFRTITPSNDPCGGAFTDFDYNVNYLTGGQYQQPVYYGFSTSTPNPISINFTIGGVAVSGVHPSGKTVVPPGTTNAPPGSGQNQKPFTVVGPNPYNPTTGCAMVAGRPCRNPHWQCTPNGTSTPACIKAPATGRVSWRQIMQ